MVKLIQNIPSANDVEQHKDNNNSITKYLESNKDKILDLAKKNYENLVEALTNNAIATASLILHYHHPYHRHSLIHTIKVIPTE
jgi:hypothetical protein